MTKTTPRERLDEIKISEEAMARCVAAVRDWEAGEDYDVSNLVRRIALLLSKSS